MRKRSTKSSAVALLGSSPLPPPDTEATRSPSPGESPAVLFDFDLNALAGIASSLNKSSNKKCVSRASGSKRIQPTGFSPSPSLKSVNTIADLKDLASSTMESIKQQMERSHSKIAKDFESSKCRLHKRYKIQTQECQRIMNEAEKEHKKMFDRINEGREAMKASYAEFIAEAQTTASRLCKTTIPELAKSSEKSISSLKSRFGIS
ncbi:uncharacterized protein LOC121781967 [Salvia splendens]|uniref:uncharacterized protein LOC121781967 n=1 Tax=Salvia splendens TaxID=180675 RepID=UPI001C27E24A|nr:uncharacterized protein LOC121781967 [Salvia splendens]